MIHRSMRQLALVLLTLTAVTSTSSAHDFTTSYSHVSVDENVVDVRLTLNVRDFAASDIAKMIEANYRVEALDRPSSMVVLSSDTIADGVLLLNLRYAFEHPVT